MNKVWKLFHRLIGCKEVKNNPNPDTLKRKIVSEKLKNIQKIKETNGVMKIMIEKGELTLKIAKK